MNRKTAKRCFDLALALPGFLAVSPVLAGVALLIKLFQEGPIFFYQTRPGLGGRPFRIVKFRTMSDRRDARGNLLPDADRLTALGKMLRATSLDELPELINVVKGDMSLVGPRPLLMQYLERYTLEQARRHAVKPGLTGWAQINGRNAITWEEKFKLDVWYVGHWSIGLDLKIIALTIKNVLRRQGISHAGEATMAEFMGSCQ